MKTVKQLERDKTRNIKIMFDKVKTANEITLSYAIEPNDSYKTKLLETFSEIEKAGDEIQKIMKDLEKAKIIENLGKL